MVSELEIVENLLKEWEDMKKGDGFKAQNSKFITLYEKALNFIKIVLKDEERLKELKNSVRTFWIATASQSEEEKAKQEWDSLKHKQGNLLRILNSLKDAIELKEKFKEEEKIDIISKELREAKKEAERRGAVLEGKYAGALIEFLDMQRQELKKRMNIEERLNQIEQKINNILEILNSKK